MARRNLLPIVLVPLIGLALFAVCVPRCRALEPEPVTFESIDGVRLQGTLFGSGERGVILAHMYPADQQSWFPMARMLAGKGYRVLTFDFRGYGKSGGKKVISEIDRDLLGAYRFLAPKVKEVFLMGASMGGTAAIRVAAREKVAGVVSLSAPVAFRGLSAREAIVRVRAPCLFVAAKGNRSAAQSAERLHALAQGPKRLLVVPGPEHGTNILKGPSGPEVREAIFQFLERNR